MNYLQLRDKLTSTPESSWDCLVERAVDDDGSLEAQARGRIQGLAYSDVSMDEDSIKATVELLVLGDAVSDGNGPNQGDDGESYDYEEEELILQLTITAGGVAWEKG